MRRVSKTEFRDMPSLDLGRDGVLEVVSHGTVVGYWVPRDVWPRVWEELPKGYHDVEEFYREEEDAPPA